MPRRPGCGPRRGCRPPGRGGDGASNAPDNPVASHIHGALAANDAAALPLPHEVSVWGALRELGCATRLDQYTPAAEVGVS